MLPTRRPRGPAERSLGVVVVVAGLLQRAVLRLLHSFGQRNAATGRFCWRRPEGRPWAKLSQVEPDFAVGRFTSRLMFQFPAVDAAKTVPSLIQVREYGRVIRREPGSRRVRQPTMISLSAI